MYICPEIKFGTFMFFGRVITKSKTLPLLDFVERTENYGQSELPTLIIGKKNAEEIFGKERIKVLDKKIDKNTYWTFAKNERRTDFEADFENFEKIIVQNIEKGVEYTYFNIFTSPHEISEKFIKWLYEGGKKYIYIQNRHLYIYSPLTNKVYGLSLMDTEYIGKEDEIILQKLADNPKNIMIENNGFIGLELKSRLKNLNIMTPYLYFLKEQ